MDKKKLVILSGAGISKESGIDTFRDKDGLWKKTATVGMEMLYNSLVKLSQKT
jgi:NAD-dependent SIR2 family protein deacetylase